MKRRKLASALGLIMVVGMLVSGIAHAEEGRRYDITITNVTRGQIISPPIVISHSRDFELFTLGASASPELAALAEDGLTEPLVNHLETLSSVLDHTVAPGPLMPGASVTLRVLTRRGFRLISAAGMLVTTNDAFFAIRGIRVPRYGAKAVEAEAYDAGSEVNSESCEFIPGPPCGNGGSRDTEGAEGYVHIHAGIHGIDDLDPAMHDWRNPVVEVSIRRVP
jgi:hypothetical protein